MIQTVKQCGKLATSSLLKVTGCQTGWDRVSIWWLQLREIRKVRRMTALVSMLRIVEHAALSSGCGRAGVWDNTFDRFSHGRHIAQQL